MIIGARTGAWAKSGGGVPTARDYVQDGLVAMWDGIENAGWGKHSNAAPVDLVNGVKLTAIGSPVITDTTFDTPNGAYYYADIKKDFRDAVVAKRFTFESVMSCVRASNNGIFSIGDRGIWIYASQNYNISTVNVLSVNYNQSINPKYIDDGVFRISVVGDTAPKVIIGTTEYSGYYGTLTSFSETRCYIGGMNNVSALSPALKSFRNIRLYSRALTADEIDANYAIDKARFKLP